MSGFGKNPFSVEVKVGDVIDLRGAQLIGEKERVLLIIIRADSPTYKIDLYAPKECENLIFGRVTAIKSVRQLSVRTGNKYFVFTHAHVELENAFGCEPTLKAENSEVAKTMKVKTGYGKGEWKRPEFTTGDVNNGEKEK